MGGLERIIEGECVIKSLINTVSDCLIITDELGKIMAVNRNFLTAYGYTQQELVGLSFEQAIEQLVVIGNINEFNKSRRFLDRIINGENLRVKCKLRHENRTIIPVEIAFSPLENNFGSVVGIVCLIEDQYTDLLKDIADIFSQTRNLGQILSKISQRLTYYYGLMDVAVFLLNDDTNNIYLRASSLINDEQMNAVSIPMYKYNLERVFLDGEILIINKDSGLGYLLRDIAYYKNFVGATIMPIKDGDKVVGATILVSELVREYQREDIKVMEQINKQIGMVVAHAHQLAKMEHLSNTDELTNLSNHRCFQESLSAILNKVSTDDEPVSLLMADIDYFKTYNDTFGHPAGDKVLRDVAQIIREHVRPTDIVARYGGEEFCVILPGCPVYIAERIAERIRQKIENYPFWGKQEMPGGNITLSIGISSYPENAITKDDLIRCADESLYRAKHLGRNKVEVYHSILDELKPELDYMELDLLNTVATLITVINAKDSYTYGHSERVTEYALAIANEMGLDKETIKFIGYGAFLHDLGKIEIERDILNKNDKLTDEEFRLIRKHPIYGAELIKPINSLSKALTIVQYHHESYDGKGYPEGLKGEDIPMEARIVCVADAFDAMTTTRPYRQAKNISEAIQELKACAGTQFDPQVVEVFLRVLNKKFGGGTYA